MVESEEPLLVAMCGIPFAGKTTLAQAISEHRNMTLLGVDATVRSEGIDVGEDAMRGIGWARAIAVTFQKIRNVLEAGDSVVFDHANHTRRSRDRCRQLAKAHGAGFVGVWVDIPPVTARERLLANRQRPRRGDVPDASFRQIIAEFEPPHGEPDVVHWTPSMPFDDLMRAMDGVLRDHRHSEASHCPA